MKLLPDTAETLIEGRLLRVKCIIDTKEVELISIYLNATPAQRAAQIDALKNSDIGHNHDSLMGGDFNCVEDVELDTRGKVEKTNKPHTETHTAPG